MTSPAPATPIDDGLGPAAWRAWLDAARRPAVDQGLRAIWADVARAVEQRGPVCWTSGRCCHFNAFGHRLYVTALEAAWVLAQLPSAAPAADSPARSEGVRLPLAPSAGGIDPAGACPFQVDLLCSVHAVRPLGCRVFFCQQGTEDWQHELYETMLDRLRRLHEREQAAYRYLEWRAALTLASGALEQV